MSFQAARGLHSTGTCDEHTWSTLVEAGWRLGDRLLHLHSPNTRGDDVVELQLLLGRLGFDCGRPDGIFGRRTERALRELQTNCGLEPDGVCGRRTVALLHGLARQSGSGPGLPTIREVEALRVPRSGLTDLRVVLGQLGGLGSLSRGLAKQLRSRGAHVVLADEPDPHTHAAMANLFGADVYLGVEPHAEPICTISYFAIPSFSSIGGRLLARQIERAFVNVDLASPAEVIGMRLPVLRETRMPAVLCALGPVRHVLDHTPEIGAALLDAVIAWTGAAAQALVPEPPKAAGR